MELCLYIESSSDDPLRKREQFAVSLRKQKKTEIIKQKRSALLAMQSATRQNGLMPASQ